MLELCKALRDRFSIAAVTNDIFTKSVYPLAIQLLATLRSRGIASWSDAIRANLGCIGRTKSFLFGTRLSPLRESRQLRLAVVLTPRVIISLHLIIDCGYR